jgi:hypothetical protein
MRHRNGLLAALGGLLIALAAPAAQADTGKVTAIDTEQKTFTIETDAGQKVTFHVDDQTAIEADGRGVRLADLALGTRVEVTAEDVAGSGQRAARTVEVHDAAGVPAATPVASDPDARGEDPAMRDAAPGEVAAARLPDTASPVHLIGLLGCLSLVLGLALLRRA